MFQKTNFNKLRGKKNNRIPQIWKFMKKRSSNYVGASKKRELDNIFAHNPYEEKM